jgi:hypothetical protein
MSPEEIRRGWAHDDALQDAYFAKLAGPWWRQLGRRIKEWLLKLFT